MGKVIKLTTIPGLPVAWKPKRGQKAKVFQFPRCDCGMSAGRPWRSHKLWCTLIIAKQEHNDRRNA